MQAPELYSQDEGILATATAGSRSWHHPFTGGFRCTQNSGVLSLKRLPILFRRRPVRPGRVPLRSQCVKLNAKQKLQGEPQKYVEARNTENCKEGTE